MEEKKQDIEYSKKVEKLKKEFSKEDIEIIRGCIHNKLLEERMKPLKKFIVEENITDEVIKDAFFALKDKDILIMAMRMGFGGYKNQKYTYKKIKEELALDSRVCDLYSSEIGITVRIILNIIDEKKMEDREESFKKWDSPDYYNKWRKFVVGPKENITKKEWREFQYNAKFYMHWAFYYDDWHPGNLRNNYNDLLNDYYKPREGYRIGPKGEEYISLCIKSRLKSREQVMLRMKYGLMKYHRMECSIDELSILFDIPRERCSQLIFRARRKACGPFEMKFSVEELQILLQKREEERIERAKEGDLSLEDVIIWWTVFYDCLDENNMPTQDRLMEEFRKYLLANKKIPDKIASKIIQLIDPWLNQYYKFALYKRCNKFEEFEKEMYEERRRQEASEELDEASEELDEASEENSEDELDYWDDEDEDEWDNTF